MVEVSIRVILLPNDPLREGPDLPVHQRTLPAPGIDPS